MSESIHGHQVMEMMAASNKSYTRAVLKIDIGEKFGENSRFHTCMLSDLTAEGLIDFLASKGKFVESEAGVSLPESNLC